MVSARYVLPKKNYQKPGLYPYTSEGYLTRNTYIIMRVNFLRLNKNAEEADKCGWHWSPLSLARVVG